MNDYSRVTGMVSGLETEKIIKDMMKIENMKLDRVKADKQIALWKQERYREFSSLLKGFESSYFDMLNKENDLLLESTYQTNNGKVLLNGKENDSVSVKFKGAGANTNLTIDKIEQLATAEIWKGSTNIHQINMNVDLAKLNDFLKADAEGKYKNREIAVAVNNEIRRIKLKNNNYTNKDDLIKELRDSFAEEYGEGVVNISDTGEITSMNNKVTIGIGEEDLLKSLGLKEGDRNYIFKNETMETLAMFKPDAPDPSSGGTDPAEPPKPKVAEISINGCDKIKISAKDKIYDVVRRINSSQNFAKLELDTVTGKFNLVAKKTGVVNSIQLDDKAKELFGQLGIDFSDQSKHEAGQNAKLKINGEVVYSASNTVEVGDVSIKLNKKYGGEQGSLKIESEVDASKVSEKIEGFIKKYNEIIEKTRKAVRERTSNYKPLTEEEKKAMEKDDIKNWEAKAKEGLLRNDSGLNKLLDDLRHIVNAKVDGVDITLKDMGIEIARDYKKGGVLEFNKAKFEKAMKEKPSQVVKFMTKQSDIPYRETDKLPQRFSENGFMQRIRDVIKGNISTVKDKNERRGYLIDKAGMKNTNAETDNEISYKIIHEYDKRINRMIEMLQNKEETYYKRFTALEKALGQLTSQQESIFSMLG